MSNDSYDFLIEKAPPAAKFTDIGDSVSGVVVQQPKKQQQTEYKTRRPLTYSDGSPMLQLVVVLRTEQDGGDPWGSDDGRRTLYVKSQSMRGAITKAVQDAGARGLDVGGELTVTYTGDGQAVNGLNPPKLFECVYVPPSESLGVAELGETLTD